MQVIATSRKRGDRERIGIRDASDFWIACKREMDYEDVHAMLAWSLIAHHLCKA